MVLLRLLAFRAGRRRVGAARRPRRRAGAGRRRAGAGAAPALRCGAPAPRVPAPPVHAAGAAPVARVARAAALGRRAAAPTTTRRAGAARCAAARRRVPAPTASRRAGRCVADAAGRPLGRAWCASWSSAGAIGALVRELAMQAQCVAIDEPPRRCWQLRVERESLRAPALRDKLQAALAQALGTRRCSSSSRPAWPTTRRRGATPPSAHAARPRPKQIIHDDPLVQALMAQFKTARIVPGSIKPH